MGGTGQLVPEQDWPQSSGVVAVPWLRQAQAGEAACPGQLHGMGTHGPYLQGRWQQDVHWHCLHSHSALVKLLQFPTAQLHCVVPHLYDPLGHCEQGEPPAQGSDCPLPALYRTGHGTAKVLGRGYTPTQGRERGSTKLWHRAETQGRPQND